jgi:WD40 repeat protein
MVALPAPADQDDFEVFVHFTDLAPGAGVGVGADGSLVFYGSRTAYLAVEDEITEDLLEESPFLAYNEELFQWDTGLNAVEQFTVTSNILNEDGDDYGRVTSKTSPVVASRTLRVFQTGEEDPVRELVYAVAFLSDAQQDLGGPSVSLDEVDDAVANLPDGGMLINVWDSEQQTFTRIGNGNGLDLGSSDPTVALDVNRQVGKIKGHDNDVLNGQSIRNVLVAFAGTMDVSGENWDLNQEIYLWDRRKFLQASESGQDIDNGGLFQVTDSIDATNRLPAVSKRGDIAFVSDADYTGENPDGSDEIFVWNARRGFRQITDLLRGDIDDIAWSGNGKTLVVGSTADITRRNPDENSEIFIWNRRNWRQVTRTIEGRNSEPSIDPSGRKIAFLSTSPLFGIPKDNEVAEVVVGRRGGRRFVQVTDTLDPETFFGDDVVHETPTITRKGKKLSVVFVSNDDLVGRNSLGDRRVYIAPLN